MTIIEKSTKLETTKPTNLAFILDSSKASEFIERKANMKTLHKIKRQSKKMNKCIVKDERNER